MITSIIKYILPIAIKIVIAYIKSSSSTKDDDILELVQEGASYLSSKNNNDVKETDAENLKRRKLIVNSIFPSKTSR